MGLKSSLQFQQGSTSPVDEAAEMMQVNGVVYSAGMGHLMQALLVKVSLVAVLLAQSTSLMGCSGDVRVCTFQCMDSSVQTVCADASTSSCLASEVLERVPCPRGRSGILSNWDDFVYSGGSSSCSRYGNSLSGSNYQDHVAAWQQFFVKDVIDCSECPDVPGGNNGVYRQLQEAETPIKDLLTAAKCGTNGYVAYQSKGKHMRAVINAFENCMELISIVQSRVPRSLSDVNATDHNFAMEEHVGTDASQKEVLV